MMRRHRRRNKKQRRIIIISVCSLLLFMTIGYAAMSTNLEIKAKGNVVKKATGADALLEMVDIVTSGDGLYEDIYEEGRYFYKGANPNNYITFSGETWRIISVENDGTIKIMKNESIGGKQWSRSDSNYWAGPATLNTYLNEEYLQTLSNLDKVIIHNWSIGKVTYYNNDILKQIADENGTVWKGSVGLITASEYLRANTNTEECETFSLNNTNNSICITTNWIYSIVSDYLWTISSASGNTFSVVDITSSGNLWTNDSVGALGVSPALYLSSDITLSGTGTETDPFIITN